MPAVTELLAEGLEHLDRHLPAGLYAAISLDTEGVRRSLRRGARPFLDPAVEPPPLHRVDGTAEVLVRQASFGALSWGGLAGAFGAASVPPEVLVNAAALLRLAQRLAVVYGFELETERGRIALWRALAAGLEIELPPEGPLDVRVRDLPAVVRRHAGASSAGTALTRAVVRQSAWSVAHRLGRMLPLVTTGFSALAARRRIREAGTRMRLALRQMALPEAEPPAIEDALEVAPPRG